MDKNEIDRHLKELGESVGWNKLLSFTNPVNLTEERNAALVDATYNPIFRYTKIPFSHEDTRQEINALRAAIGDSMTGLEAEANLGIMDQFLLSNTYLEVMDSEHFQEATEQIFSRPEQADVEWARERYKTELPGETKPFGPADVQDKMYLYMDEIFPFAGINQEYEIIIDPNRANIFVEEEEGRIRLPDRNVSADKLAGDNAHEIGIHVVQYEIGRMQPLPAFWIGFPFRSFISEGLALYNENLVSPDYAPREKTMAGNTIAMVMTEEHSFSDIYNELLSSGFEKEEAFKCTLMAKRGLSDTSKRGANFNRNIYARGLRMVREYLENGGDEWVLYTGRVNLDYADDIKNMEGLYRPPEDLPQKLRDMASQFWNSRTGHFINKHT